MKSSFKSQLLNVLSWIITPLLLGFSSKAAAIKAARLPRWRAPAMRMLAGDSRFEDTDAMSLRREL